jgi:hypothetical protein
VGALASELPCPLGTCLNYTVLQCFVTLSVTYLMVYFLCQAPSQPLLLGAHFRLPFVVTPRWKGLSLAVKSLHLVFVVGDKALK